MKWWYRNERYENVHNNRYILELASKDTYGGFNVSASDILSLWEFLSVQTNRGGYYPSLNELYLCLLMYVVRSADWRG